MKKVTVFLIAVGFAAAAALALANQHTIVQKGKQFSQVSLSVGQGDSVLFKNDDKVAHNLFTTSNGYSLNEVQKPGDSSTVVFDKKGTVVIRCAIHPKMKLTVKVD